MSHDVGASSSAKGKSKGMGKGGPPAPPAPSGGPPKSNTPSFAFKVKTVDRSQGETARQNRLHMTAAQQIVAAQEHDGHFDAKALAMKLDRLWGKLMVSEPPSDPKGDLSADLVDATVFVVRLFECFVDKSGCSEDDKRREVISWFGSNSLLGDRWLDEATSWLNTQQSGWRETRAECVDVIVNKWFATDSDCKLPEIDNTKLQAKQAEMSEKFAASQIESLRREKLWRDNQPVSDISTVSWEKATAVRWCFGGGGGCFLVRVGDEKFLVKGCQDEGDVLAHELARIVGIRVAAVRFVSPASAEFDLAHRCLTSAQPDEPEHGRNLLVQLTKLRKTGCPLMVMEFVCGDSLQDRLGSEALERGEEGFMRNLGRVLAMDTLMNNWDRMPALRSWPSAGNLGNVLVTGEGQVMAIDQALQLLCEPQVRADYYHVLRSFVDEVNQSNRLEGEGLKRIKKAVQSQVMKWTGDVEKDAKTFQQFMIKPDSAQGVVLADSACCFLLEGAQEVFSQISTLRAEFLAKKSALLEITRGYFVEMDGEHHVERIEAGALFIEECMGTVESEDLYKNYVQATHKNSIVFPGRKFFSTLQCKPEVHINQTVDEIDFTT